MYLQMHDDWTSEPNYPGFTTDEFASVGKTPMPLKKVYALNGTCSVVLPSALLKSTGQGWLQALKDAIGQYNQIAQGKKKTPQEQVDAAKFTQYGGTKSQMADASAAIAVISKWAALGTAVYALIATIANTIINNKAMSWYNANKFGVQDLCAMNAQQVADQLNAIDLTYANLLEQRSQMTIGNILGRSNISVEIAALSQYRLVYQQHLDSLTGKKADLGKIAAIVGIIAAARNFF